MRIRILSDLRRKIGTADQLDIAADVAVLAGDIDRGIKGVVWAQQAFPSILVLDVAGNHEHYHERFGRLHEKLGEATASLKAMPNQRDCHDAPRSESASNADSWTTAIEH